MEKIATDYLTNNKLKYLGYALLWIVIVVLWFNPTSYVISNMLDSSGQGLFTFYTQNKFQYGIDAIHVVGPYGFVNYGVYTGNLYYAKYLIELLVKTITASLMIGILIQGKSRFGILWIATCTIFAWRIFDVVYNFSLMFAAIYLLTCAEQSGKKLKTAIISGFLGFYFLMKGTYVIVSIFSIGVVVLYLILLKKKNMIPYVLVSYVSVIVLAWLFAGQSLFNLFEYLKSILVLSSGYNEANALMESRSVFMVGATITIFLNIIILFYMALGLKKPINIFIGLICLFYTFLAWKHGFVRADGHVQGLYHYGISVVLLIPVAIANDKYTCHLSYDNKGAISIFPVKYLLLKSLPAILIVAVIGLSFLGGYKEHTARLNLRVLPLELKNRILQNIESLLHPSRKKHVFDNILAQNKLLYELPQIEKIVGSDKIDIFGYEFAVPMLNNFNFQPKPVAASFEAHGTYLMKKNEAFMQDITRRPEYILFKMQSIDNRLPGQDDSLALKTIFNNYHPVYKENDFILLQASHETDIDIPQIFIGAQSKAFDETIEIPIIDNDEIVYAYINIDPNLMGKMRAFLYKPPICDIVLTYSNGRQREHRILPSNIKNGFIIDIALNNYFDIYLYFHVLGVPRAKEFKITLVKPDEMVYFRKAIEVKFFKQKRTLYPVEYPFLPGFNLEPNSIKAFDVRIEKIDNMEVLYLHAPAEITFALPPDISSINGDFGILPSAHQTSACTDGVDFKIFVERLDKSPQLIWQRFLEPTTKSEDRGIQSFKVNLAETQSEIVKITTGIGPRNHGNCDFSYLGNIQFH